MDFAQQVTFDPNLEILLESAVLDYEAHRQAFNILEPWATICNRWSTLDKSSVCLQKTFRWLALEHFGNHNLPEHQALAFAQLIRPGRSFRLYDLTITQFYRLGGRLCARTMVELTKDEYIKTIIRHLPTLAIDHVIDPFVGSGNTLYHLTRHAQCEGKMLVLYLQFTKSKLILFKGTGYEIDSDVLQNTHQTLCLLQQQHMRLKHANFMTERALFDGDNLLFFLSPPWGNALAAGELDLSLTYPRVHKVVSLIIERCIRVPSFSIIIQIKPRVKLLPLMHVRRIIHQYGGLDHGIIGDGKNVALLFSFSQRN